MRLYIALVLTFFFAQTAEAKKIPMFVFFSESHRVMFDDWFKPTLPDEFDLHVYNIEQFCPTASFRDKGWKETVRNKLIVTLDMIDLYWGDIIVYSDVDIQFFRPIADELLSLMEGRNFLIQLSKPTGHCCSGFYVVRANEEMKDFFQKALKQMDLPGIKGDEAAINKTLKENPDVNWGHLPISYYCAGTITARKWKPGKDLPLPENLALHHANYTKGIENKILQFQFVREKVEKGGYEYAYIPLPEREPKPNPFSLFSFFTEK